MPYDPTIALRAVQPQIDFGGAVQNAMAFRNAQQINQLNQLKLAQEQQAMQQEAGLRNYLAQSPNLSAPETQRQLIGQFGAAGMDVVNKELQRRQFQSAIDKAGRENVTEALGTVRDMYAGVLARHADNLNSEEALKDYLEVSRTAHNNPFLGEALKTTGASLANTFTKGQTALESGTLGNLIQTSAMSADQLRQSLTPKQTTPTELEKLISLRNVYKVGTQERTDLENKIKLETTRAPAASTTVNLPPQELAESKAFGEQLVKDYSENIKPAADQARKNLNTVDVLQNLLDKGLQTGWGTDLEGQARSALARMGVEGAKDLAGDIQTFKAFVRQNVLNEQMKQKGVQTEGDAQRIEETFARLGNTTESNRFLLDVRRAQLNRDIAQQKFWTDWKSKHGTFDGAENAWLEGEGSKSLFDAPTLKKYKPAAAPAGAKAMPTGVKLKTYADQHFNGDQVKAKAYLTSQGYK